MANLIKKKSKIMIVEDHPIFRYGLTELINRQETLTVCADADNASDALKKIPLVNPDLIIVGNPGDGELSEADYNVGKTDGSRTLVNLILQLIKVVLI